MKKIAVVSAICLLSAALIIAACFYTGALWFNMPSKEEYPVWGVDVSLLQGEIDWAAMSREKLDYAYIAATSGAANTDERFSENWHGAKDAGLLTGAYHILSDGESGAAQAAHFIKTVPWGEEMLPPVIQIELDPQSQTAAQILADMVSALESHYGVKPILHVSHEMFEVFVEGKYGGCPIWIRDIFSEPQLSDGREWLMWHYSPQGWIPAYSGGEWNIDLNVFSGSRGELRQMLLTAPPPASTQAAELVLMCAFQ